MVFDIIVHNGILLTVNDHFDLIEDGLLAIAGHKIVRIDKKKDAEPLPEAETVIDAEGGIIMPGLVNAHTHLPMSLFRGLADDLPLMVWLNEHIFPAENKYIQPETVKLGTLISCSEMLLSGTTTCCDGYFYEDIVAQAVQNIGLRGVLAQGIIGYPAPGVPDPGQNIEHARKFIQNRLDAVNTITPSVFCHSPYTCSADTLKKAKKLADDNGLLFQIHAAETGSEKNLIGKDPTVSPIRYLDQLGLLDGNTLIVHAVWTDADDIEIIKKRGAGIAHNPESNMKLAAGVAPVPAFVKARINVGLGTDGAASNNNLDLLQEMDSAAKLHKVTNDDPTVMDAEMVIKMATIQGARAIGLGDRIGSLEIGKQADIIIIDTHKPHLVPMHNPVSQVVYAACGSDVRDVIVDGKMIIRNRQFRRFNLDKMMVEAKAFAHKV